MCTLIDFATLNVTQMRALPFFIHPNPMLPSPHPFSLGLHLRSQLHADRRARFIYREAAIYTFSRSHSPSSSRSKISPKLYEGAGHCASSRHPPSFYLALALAPISTFATPFVFAFRG
ncbi:unnamed protein product [Mortierella alpina]